MSTPLHVTEALFSTEKASDTLQEVFTEATAATPS